MTKKEVFQKPQINHSNPGILESSDPSLKSIVILTGPTAAGKSQISLAIAQELNLDIINADSMQVYRYLDIGTAKPSKDEQKIVKHHLIDIVNPDEQYNAGRYKEDADKIILELHKEKKLPLIVGGTGLYIKALIFGLFSSPPKDFKISNELKSKEKALGIGVLYSELKRIDPTAASRIKPKDRQRILRALEVFYITGKPISFFQNQHGFRQARYRYLYLCLRREREELNERIEKRINKMIENGFEEEVRNLLKRGYSEDLNSLCSLGYKEMIGYIKGKYKLSEAVNLIKQNTKRYAKRQFTWFNTQPNVTWIDLEGDDIEKPLKEIKERIKAITL